MSMHMHVTFFCLLSISFLGTVLSFSWALDCLGAQSNTERITTESSLDDMLGKGLH
jgi:hypothetical protein